MVVLDQYGLLIMQEPLSCVMRFVACMFRYPGLEIPRHILQWGIAMSHEEYNLATLS